MALRIQAAPASKSRRIPPSPRPPEERSEAVQARAAGDGAWGARLRGLRAAGSALPAGLLLRPAARAPASPRGLSPTDAAAQFILFSQP